MSLVWNQRIAHFDRPVKHRHLRRFKKQYRKEQHRRRRGLPSRSIDAKLCFAEARLRINLRLGTVREEEAEALAAKFEFAQMHSRLLERKRLKLRAVVTARRSTGRERINRWRRRQIWLEQVESLNSAPSKNH
jgi:hypothetical protein